MARWSAAMTALHPRATDELCQRCGAGMLLLTLLPAHGNQPAYRIFGCTKCTFLKWTEEITGQ